MTDGHTLVIPTFNRPALLRRLVQYYRGRAPSIPLLVLDSSTPEIVEENGKTLAGPGGMVRHAKFPETVPVVSKLAQGLAQVQTPYASFCADDDLVFPDGLGAATTFLKDHPDYVSAHGLYLNFSEAGDDVHLTREYAGPGIEAEHPGARIFRLCQKYESLFYGVFRTAEARDIFEALPALSTIVFQELFQSLAAVITGKVRRLPVLFAARRSGPPAEPGRDKWQTHYWFAGNPGEVVEQYRAYCGELWKFYDAHAAKPRLEKEPFFRTLDLAHAVYFSAACPPEYFYSALQPYWPDDPYVRVGPLDTLNEANRLLTRRRILWPLADDGTDLFERLRTPAELPQWLSTGFGGGSRYLWQTAWSGVPLARLNREVKRACRTSWKCHLPRSMRWLASVLHFRDTYLELCRYLDQS